MKTDMREIIFWLIGIEDASARFYEKASQFFAGDADLKVLLTQLMEDERIHCSLMEKAYEIVKDCGNVSQITFDAETRGMIEGKLVPVMKKLEAGDITKEELLESVIAIEFSEVNGVFLYAIEALKAHPTEYDAAIRNIRGHKRRIERFIKLRPEFAVFLDKLKAVPDVGSRNLLVVDDEKAMINIFTTFLSEEGAVDSAANGAEALKKLAEKDFSAIISDVDMPVMNGINFFTEAVRKFPGINNRFLFLTGSFDESRLSFFRKNNVKYLIKPVSIKDIRKNLNEILKNPPYSRA